MKKLKNTKGLTLLEVIISIAILGIIATAFLNLFGNSFVSIASFGGKSEAVLGASDILEQVYSYTESDKDLDSLETKLEELGGVEKENEEKLYEALSEGKFNYRINNPDLKVSGQSISGINLTIAVPNGKKGSMEKLSSFIPGVN